MKTIGTHAKHALALFLALIMLFGIVSVPAFAYEGSTASTGGEENSSAGGEESGGGSSDTEGTKDTPWYTLTYNYTTKQMTLVLKMEDLLSYADLTAEDLVTFKDEFFDALVHMLVGDISDIKKPASSTESSSEEGTLRIVTLPDFAPLLDGGTTALSEREKQLRAFLESRGITKVSQIDFEAIIPVLIQLGYVTYEELAEIDWNRVFAKFEEELDKEIDRDIAVDIAKDNGDEEPVRENYADDESYLAAKETYDSKIAHIIQNKNTPEYRGKFEEKANSTEIQQKKTEALGQITDAKVKVEAKIEEKKNDPSADDRSDDRLIEAILSAMKGVTVDGHKIFDGTYFLSDALREVLRELPTADEIANYTDEQMKHTWSVYAESAFGDSTFDFTISFDGGGNLIRKLARLVADTVVYERRDDGTHFITLNLPKKVTDLILRACNSEKFQNSAWKDRIFGHIADNGNDIYALVNDVTFEEIISALEEIDFEGLLSRDDIKDIYDVSHLSNDEIIAKLRKTERFYKKALSLFNNLFTRLPEGTKAKTLFDFYRGNGSFRAEERKENLNVEEWLSRVLPEKYKNSAGVIASFLESETLTIGLDVTVNFTDMYKVTFTGDETELGFLPAGAKLADFVKATTYNGYRIIGWKDADGKTYTVMPAADTELYPVTDVPVLTVEASESVDMAYDPTKSITLTVTPRYREGEWNFSYQWYKNGELLEGEIHATLEVPMTVGEAVYTCVVSVEDGDKTVTGTSGEISVKISPKNILIAAPRWNYASSLTYKGSDYTFVIPALADHPYLNVRYENNTAKNVDTYEVTAIVTPKNENCLVNGKKEVKYSATFRIEPKTISVDLIEWEEETFVYDGETHRPTLRDLDSYSIAGVYEPLADIFLIRDYAGEFASDVLPDGANLYTVTVFLALKDDNPNYRLTASKKVLDWNITPKPLDIDGVKLKEDLFDYDGTEKKVELLADSIPEELLAELDLSTEITATDRGSHSVTVNFTLKAGYNRLNYTFDTSVNISYRIVTAIDPADFTLADAGYVYNGSEQTVPALSFGDYAALVSIAGSEGTLTSTDAGTYRVTYTFALTNSALYRLTSESYTYEWTIAKQKIIVGTLNWNYDPENPFVYNKNTFTVALTNEIENVLVSYENASATDAGTYLAKAILTPVSENYEIVLEDEASTELSWTVKQAVIRIPAPEWSEKNAFEYNENEQHVGLKTELPEDITVEYENAAMTDAGKYLAKATLLAKDKNYRVAIGDTEENTVTLEWEITPRTVIVGTLEWNYTDRSFVFSTDSRSFLITNLPAHVSAVYENNTIGDVGTYTLKATLVADKNYKIQGTEEETFDFKVTPLTVTVNASDLRWTTDAASERYDGTTHTYTLIGVPAHVVIRYTDNASAEIGNYVAKAVLEAESKNYTLVVGGEIPEQAWSIVKGKYDMSGVKFEDRTVEYDGKAKTFTISGKLPAGVSVTYNLSNFKDAGVYVVTATFKGSQNYEEIPSMTATLTITRLQYTVAVDGNDTLIITAPSGLTYTLKFIEKANTEFQDQSFLGIGTLNEQIKLAAAYDIFFTEDGETEIHPEGNFEVKLLIPEALRTKDIKVVHRNDNGKLTDMKATRDGDYMVFTTDGFSVYFLVEATEILSSLWITVIMIALCVLLVLIIILEIVAWRKKKKKRNARKEYPDILKGADPTVFNFGK